MNKHANTYCYFYDNSKRQQALQAMIEIESKYCKLRKYRNQYSLKIIKIFEVSTIPYTLDLHGFTCNIANQIVSEFIITANKHKLPIIRIIYGKGRVLNDLVSKEIENKLELFEGCKIYKESYKKLLEDELINEENDDEQDSYSYYDTKIKESYVDYYKGYVDLNYKVCDYELWYDYTINQKENITDNIECEKQRKTNESQECVDNININIINNTMSFVRTCEKENTNIRHTEEEIADTREEARRLYFEQNNLEAKKRENVEREPRITAKKMRAVREIEAKKTEAYKKREQQNNIHLSVKQNEEIYIEKEVCVTEKEWEKFIKRSERQERIDAKERMKKRPMIILMIIMITVISWFGAKHIYNYISVINK